MGELTGFRIDKHPAIDIEQPLLSRRRQFLPREHGGKAVLDLTVCHM